jgi:hypothetical protein
MGDTTVVTEHRDPYSFYWQLDTLRRMEREPRRRLPPVSPIIDEVDEDEEEEEEEEEEPEPERIYEVFCEKIAKIL